jgi:hypothetical protein
MKTAPAYSLLALALVVACGADSELPAELGPGVSAHAFFADRSAWFDVKNVGEPVNSACQDQTPTLSRDELSLYFLSDRPGGLGNLVPATGCLDNFDLWVARRACTDADDDACDWQTPVNLGSAINTLKNDVAPALSPDGHLLFFSSDRDDQTGLGLHDIYVSWRADPNDDLGWGPPVPLGPDVNTALHEAGPFYLESAEDGAASLYFYRGEDNAFTTDIYVAPVTRDGRTVGPAVKDEELSHPNEADGFVTVRADGRELLFNSSRPGGLNRFDIWVSTRRSVHDAWSPPEPLGAPVNSEIGAEFQPDLSHDGRTLLFITGSGARGGSGRQDIWGATRTPSGR